MHFVAMETTIEKGGSRFVILIIPFVTRLIKIDCLDLYAEAASQQQLCCYVNAAVSLFRYTFQKAVLRARRRQNSLKQLLLQNQKASFLLLLMIPGNLIFRSMKNERKKFQVKVTTRVRYYYCTLPTSTTATLYFPKAAVITCVPENDAGGGVPFTA